LVAGGDVATGVDRDVGRPADKLVVRGHVEVAGFRQLDVGARHSLERIAAEADGQVAGVDQENAADAGPGDQVADLRLDRGIGRGGTRVVRVWHRADAGGSRQRQVGRGDVQGASWRIVAVDDGAVGAGNGDGASGGHDAQADIARRTEADVH